MIGNPVIEHGGILEVLAVGRLGESWQEEASEEEKKIANMPDRAHDDCSSGDLDGKNRLALLLLVGRWQMQIGSLVQK